MLKRSSGDIKAVNMNLQLIGRNTHLDRKEIIAMAQA